LDGCDKDNDLIFMCEVWEEATYVKHHKKKIAFLFSAMRHFANDLIKQGYRVHYTTLDDPQNTGSFKNEIQRALSLYDARSIIVTSPGEYRVLQDMLRWSDEFSIPVEIRPDTRFLCSPEEFKIWVGNRKVLRMEFFYRDMRKKYKILMAGNSPEGGEWNYDNKNRNPLKNTLLFVPKTPVFSYDQITQDVLKLVGERFQDHFGDLEPFNFAVTRADALTVLDKFIKERLPFFGEFQDVMVEGEPWLYHSHISFYLNCGLLDPLDVIRAAEASYYCKKAPLNAVEGFIRQIVGWREYIRGIYWLKMPDYADPGRGLH
jgi:deoxyribodipyrimidine photolyase-related protein